MVPASANSTDTSIRICRLQVFWEPNCSLKLIRTPVKETVPYYLLNVAPDALPREWRRLVLDHPSETQAFNRRQLEGVAMLELAAAIKAGEMFVTGSLSYDRFWDRLPREAADPAAIGAYAASQGWGEGADGFIRTLQESLGRQEGVIERAL